MPQNPYQTALDSLKKYGSGVYTEDPSSALLNEDDIYNEPLSPGGSPLPKDPGIARSTYQRNYGNELETRQFNAIRSGQIPEAAALHGLLNSNDQDIARTNAPYDRDMKQIEDSRNRNRIAIEAGYGGTRQIAKDYQPDGQITAAGAFDPDRMEPSAKMTQVGLAQDRYKIDAPLRLEQEKSRGDRALATDKFKRMIELERVQSQGGIEPAVSHEPGAGGAPPASASPNQNPSKPLGSPMDRVKDFVMGTGATPYNSLKDFLNAKTERTLYGKAATPYSDAVQNISYGNLQQLSGQFPGVRGFGYLLPKLQEHQARPGDETPAATYARLQGMDRLLSQSMGDFDNPSLVPKFKTAANGDITIAQDPQMIIRGKLALKNANDNIRQAIEDMKTLYPGIGGNATPPGPPAGGSKYERVQ